MTGQIPKLKHTRSGHNSSPAWDSLMENNTQNMWTLLVIDLCEPLINIWVSSLRFGSYMLSWMNFLILLLVYLSSVYFTLLSSNLFLSCGGRKRTIPLQTDHREVRKEDALIICCTDLQISSLCLDVLALEEGLRVGVSKTVLVPERAGGLQKLSLCGALVVSKESWEKNKTEYVVLTTKNRSSIQLWNE